MGDSGHSLQVSMGSMKQQRILPSGVQRANRNILDSAGDYFGYASALAINIFRFSTKRLERIVPAHSKTVAGFTISPSNPDLFATVGDDLLLKRWNIKDEKETSTLRLNSPPIMIQWCPEGDAIAVLLKNGYVYLWNEGKTLEKITGLTEAIRIRWDHNTGGENYAPRLAIGHRNGTLSVWDKTANTFSRVLLSTPNSQPSGLISDVQWDPSSNLYVLVSFEEGVVFLADPAQQLVHAECLSDKPIVMASFLQGDPGDFLTIDQEVPVLSLWNVSQVISTSRHRIKHKASKIVSIKAVTNPDFPRHVLIAFGDGSIGVFNHAKKEFVYLSEPFHSETVFDLNLKPANSDIFATAANDGSLKIWDVSNMECLQHLNNNEAIYAVSWCPGDEDENRVVTASISGQSTIWDVKDGKVISRFRHHAGPSYRVAWNPLDANVICSTSADMSAVVFQARDPTNPSAPGSVLRKYIHPNMVYGCSWSRFNKNLLATGCHDGTVRIFDTSSQGGRPIQSFTGHRDRVFNVAWSPLLPGHLASGSDDRTIRVWKLDARPNEPPIILKGHEHNIRGLAWHHEVPFLLISGSWGGVIKVWDIRNERCLQTLQEHHADVYSIVSHPNRPYTFITSSRDTSVRIWAANECFSARAQLEGVMDGGSLRDSATSDIKSAMHPYLQKALMCGKRSQNMLQAMKDDFKESELKRQSLLFDFYYSAPGVKQFFELLESLLASKATPANARIQHVNDLWKVQYTLARQLQTSPVKLGSGTKAEQLQRAGEIFVLLGCMKNYCEILIDLEQWDTAIALAPSVSATYWKQVSEKYADYLMARQDRRAIPYLVASGNMEKLTNFQLSLGDSKGAFVATVSHSMEKLPDLSELPIETKEEQELKAQQLAHQGSSSSILENEGGQDEKEARESVDVSPAMLRVVKIQADSYIAAEQPILAACCYLAIGEPNSALQQLMLGDEVLLAECLVQVLGLDSCDYVFEELSKRCEMIGMWDDALSVLQKVEQPGNAIMLLAARCDKPAHEKVDFYLKANLPRIELLVKEADQMLNEGKHADAVVTLLCAGEEHKGIELAFEAIHDLLNKPSWSIGELETLVEPLNSVHAHLLPASLKAEVLVYSCLLGSQRAYTYGYGEIGAFLGEAVISLCAKAGMQSPIPPSFFKMQELTYFAGVDPERALRLVKELLASPSLPGKLKPNVTSIKKTIEQNYANGNSKLISEPNRIIPGLSSQSTHAPSGSHAISVITKKPCTGHPVLLEDGATYIGLNEARMFLKCTPYTPIFSGYRFSFDGSKRVEPSARSN